MAITQAVTTSFKSEVLQGVHNLSTDVFKLALYTTNADLSSVTTVYTPLEETTGTGYTAGGAVLTNTGVLTSGSVAYASWEPVSWIGATFTAAGALLYNASKGNKSVAVFNFGGSYTTNGTPPFTVTFPANTSTTAVITFS